MAADHSNTIIANLYLSPSPPSRASFSTVLFLVDYATNPIPDRVVAYADASEVAAALVATDISATTASVLTKAFTQIPTLSNIKVAYWDTVGLETLSSAMTAIQAFDDDWYGSVIYSRADADIAAWAALVEARRKLFIAQSADATWLTAGVPAGLSTIDGVERTATIYHDVDAEPADICWLASRLVFDPDTQSAGWEGQIRSVAGLTTGLTAAQRDFAEANNCNLGLPFSSADVYVSPGVNMNGRGIYEILSADWYITRVSEDMAYLKLQHTARGAKIPVNAEGQVKVMGILNSRLQQGVAAGHFVKGQTRVTPIDITTADETARRLRFKVEAQIAGDTRIFMFNVYVQPDALQSA